jgi:hypothetical protein
MGGTVTDKTSASLGALAINGTANVTTTHTFATAGNYSIQVCADKTSSAGGGVITESNESDNCGYANVTVSSIVVSVNASPLIYNVLPGATVLFAYTSSTNSGSGTECKLINYNKTADETIYQSVTPTSISYTVPSSENSFGYYVRCRDKVTVTATADSSLITINTSCPLDTTFIAGSCKAPEGTLNITSPIDNQEITLCKIGAGLHSCPINISWTTTNPLNPVSAVTTDPSNTIVGGGGTGSPSTNAGSVSNYEVDYNYPSGRIFYLYHNTGELVRKTIVAECDTGTFWDGGKCVIPSRSLSSGGCSIKVNEGPSCSDANLEWSVTNPLGDNRVEASYGTSPIVSLTSNNSGTATYSITYGIPKTLTLYSGGQQIGDTIQVDASCVLDTHFDDASGKCLIDNPAITTFQVKPESIFEGGSATITWNSPLATSCTGSTNNTEVFNTSSSKSGSLKVSPKLTTEYTLTCKNGATSQNTIIENKTVKVLDITIKEQ